MKKLSKALFSSEKEDWETPQEFFDELDREFHFTLDPCADDMNAKCEKYFTKKGKRTFNELGWAHSILQSSVWTQDNRGVDKKVLRRSAKARDHSRCTYSCPNRYHFFSRIHMA